MHLPFKKKQRKDFDPKKKKHMFMVFVIMGKLFIIHSLYKLITQEVKKINMLVQAHSRCHTNGPKY